MVDQTVWLIIAVGVEVTPIERLKVEISEKNWARKVLITSNLPNGASGLNFV